MRTLLQALHALAAKQGDGLLPEFLPAEHTMDDVPKRLNESPAAHQKEELEGDVVEGGESNLEIQPQKHRKPKAWRPGLPDARSKNGGP